MGALGKIRVTEQDYLAAERIAPTKSEFVDGEVYGMSGGSEQHSLIATNCTGLLHAAFTDRPCRVYNSDMKVRTELEGTQHYPDLSALCGQPDFFDDKRDVLLNPTLLLEVLSASTEAYDRGRKFALYRGIPSLQEYILIDQGQILIDVYRRQSNNTWALQSYSNIDDTITLTSIDCELPIRAIYDKVELESD
ncbi:MAG: Uma2 family endonuclease [Verrucomicrobiae bacterium]|nr:Uma2 family endonuclease [Verrucomicrobiae bacterium]